MTPERAALLGELLEEMMRDHRGFIPEGAWTAVQKAFAMPYLELAIVRHNLDNGMIEILLTHRTDKDWTGWHIPGGLWRRNLTIEQGITLLAKTELGDEVTVKFLAKGDWEKWHDHPYAVPISHVVICSAISVVETETRRWFSEVPDGMIDDHGHHAKFIESVLRQTEEQKIV